MIHRLPFSNLVIEPSPAVMPGNIESKPYSIQSFNYWQSLVYDYQTEPHNTIFELYLSKTKPDRNWGAENVEEYKSNKVQGEDIFLKFVPRGPYEDKIYVGVVQLSARQFVSANEEQTLYQYVQPVAYQIGVGDCDIKHRPWTNLIVSFDVDYTKIVQTYDDDGDQNSFVKTIESSYSDSITITAEMFSTTPEISYMPANLNANGPWYVEGYGQVDVSWQSGEQFYDADLGQIRTFWTVTDEIGEITTFLEYDNAQDDNLLSATSYIPLISKITSITPASVFEPPIPE